MGLQNFLVSAKSLTKSPFDEVKIYDESIDVDTDPLNVTASISNISNSTNESSPIIPDGKKTGTDFCKNMKIDEDTNSSILSLSKEINMNKVVKMMIFL